MSHFVSSPVAKRKCVYEAVEKGMENVHEAVGPHAVPYELVPESWSVAGCQVFPDLTRRTSRQGEPMFGPHGLGGPEGGGATGGGGCIGEGGNSGNGGGIEGGSWTQTHVPGAPKSRRPLVLH